MIHGASGKQHPILSPTDDFPSFMITAYDHRSEQAAPTPLDRLGRQTRCPSMNLRFIIILPLLFAYRSCNDSAISPTSPDSKLLESAHEASYGLQTDKDMGGRVNGLQQHLSHALLFSKLVKAIVSVTWAKFRARVREGPWIW